MKEIVFFLEEQSSAEMLQGIKSKITLEDIPFRFVTFEGKQDLDKQLSKKIHNYLNPDARFIILRDQGPGNCKDIKNTLQKKCCEDTRKRKIRIACHELESFYLADLKAIELAYNKPNLSRLQEKKKYRNPDDMPNPLQILTDLIPEYQKVDGSRLISEHLNLNNYRSKSFKNLILAIRELITY